MDPFVGIELSPVPAKNQVTVSLLQEDMRSEKVEILIYNAMGNLVKTSQYKTSDKLNIAVDDLSSGWYILALKTEGAFYLKRMIIE